MGERGLILRIAYYAVLWLPHMALRALSDGLLVKLGLKIVQPTGRPIWRWRWRWRGYDGVS